MFEILLSGMSWGAVNCLYFSAAVTHDCTEKSCVANWTLQDSCSPLISEKLTVRASIAGSINKNEQCDDFFFSLFSWGLDSGHRVWWLHVHGRKSWSPGLARVRLALLLVKWSPVWPVMPCFSGCTHLVILLFDHTFEMENYGNG